jgi:hypothetical protein
MPSCFPPSCELTYPISKFPCTALGVQYFQNHIADKAPVHPVSKD